MLFAQGLESVTETDRADAWPGPEKAGRHGVMIGQWVRHGMGCWVGYIDSTWPKRLRVRGRVWERHPLGQGRTLQSMYIGSTRRLALKSAAGVQ